MKYTTSTGWVINPRKLKEDDRLFLKTLDLAGDTARENFIDECIVTYLKAWGIDLVDYTASLKEHGLLESEA